MCRISRWMALVAVTFALVTVIVVGGAVGAEPTGAVVAAGPGAISGTVSDGTAGIAGVAVRAYDAPTGTFVAKTTTDATGHYTISGLPVGGYKVLVNGTDANWQIQFFGGSTTMADATVVQVVAGPAATADVVLLAGGGILVDLHNQLGYPTPCLRDVPIRIYDLTGRTLVAKTTAVVITSPMPTFIGGLLPGSYLVRVGDGIRCNVAWWSGTEYGVGNRLAAVPVTVVAGETTPVKVATLQTVTIEGTVTDSSTGAGVEGIDVRLYVGYDDGYAPEGSLAGKTRTGPDGHWVLPAMRGGALAARFSDAAGNYSLVWYQDQPTFADSTRLIAFPATVVVMDQSMTPIP